MFDKLFGPSGPSTLLQAALDDVSEMLATSRRMLEISLRALLDDRPPETDLDSMDDSVDEGERMVRRSVLEHLSFNPQQDLVFSLVLVSMVQDAERTGDFALGIAELSDMADRPLEGPFRDELAEIAARVPPLFEDCERAFRHGDVEEAKAVITRAAELRLAFHEFTLRVARSDVTADLAVVYSGAARSLRRVAAHLSNIGSSVAQPYDRIRHEERDLGPDVPVD